MFSSTNKNLTISYKQTDGSMLEDEFRDILIQHGIRMVPAEDVSPDHPLPLLRITKKGLYLEEDGLVLTFHPSMSLLRMININKGIGDRFLEAVSLQAGDVFLDCTMGLVSDALIASSKTGHNGKVIALEQSPLIYLLVRDGLTQMKKLIPPGLNNPKKIQAWHNLIDASTRIETVCANHLDYLKELPDKSVDVIYFDPMFRETRAQSCSMRPIKIWSYPEPLDIETISQARRVARKRIVLKERRTSTEFERLGFDHMLGSKYSPIDFGIIELTGKGE